MKLIVSLFAVVVLGGCRLGTPALMPEVATLPDGVWTRLQVESGSYQGELITLEDEAFLIRTRDPARLIRIPFAMVTAGGADGIVEFDGGALGRASLRQRLRLVSRYPQGVDENLEQALLDAYGLLRVEEVAP